MTKVNLCKTCGNKDIRYIHRGHNYKPEMACDYDMEAFPNSHACNKYNLYERSETPVVVE